MDEGNVAVLERPTTGSIQENPTKLKHERDEMRRIYYSKAVKERDGHNLPETEKELREMWDRQVDELAEQKEQNKEQDAEDVPDIVLRDNEKGWEEVGWPKEKRDRVKRQLEEVLGLKEPFLTHALECIVAAGRTPEEAEAQITQENRQRIYDAIPPQDNRGNQTTEQDKVLATKALFLEDILGGLKNKQRYVKRFILYDEFNDRSLPVLSDYGGLGHEGYGASLKDEFSSKLPDNLFDLAWNIGFEKQGRYGIDGKFPVLRMQVHKDKDGKVEGRYVADQANFMQWMREHIWQWYEDVDTDEVTDYFSKIKIEKGSFYSINLITMLFNKKLYFSDETGHYWGGLWNQVLFEPWMMYFMRTYYLEYEKSMGSEEKLAETYNNTFFLSKFTRKLEGSSMIGKLATLPMDYQGENSDTKLGEAFQTMFLIYYNMSDPVRLKEILGEDSEFFTRDFWINAIKEISMSDLKQTGMPKMTDYLGDNIDSFVDAFRDGDKATNEVKNWDAFVKFLNYFPVPVPTSTWVQVIDKGIKNIVKDKFTSKTANLSFKGFHTGEKQKDGSVYDEDEFSLNYAWLIAHSWKYITGAAAKNNFPAVSGHNAETKWFYPYAYRLKYMTYGGGGNPYTIPMFKQLSLPLLEGILTENAYVDYEVNEHGHSKEKRRSMTPMEIMMQMSNLRLKYDQERRRLKKQLDSASDSEAETLRQELAALDDEETTRYKILSSQLVFKQDSMRNYAQNIVGRSKVLYEQLMGANEIDFEKFTKYDGVFRGVSFDRAEWQKALQNGLITPLRYLFDANGATQMNMKVRAPTFTGMDNKGKPKWKFEETSLAEAMLGYEVINIPEFRTQVSELSPQEWRERKAQGYKRRGRYIVKPNGRYELDANKMQENKTMVYKQWMLMKLGGDLWTHIDRHSTDPAYNMSHYLGIIEAIESLPGNLAGDDKKMQDVRVSEMFFSHHQMKWLRKISGTTMTKLYSRQFWADVFTGDKKKKESKFGESASIILTAIFKGY
jgi:hypothetical protein